MMGGSLKAEGFGDGGQKPSPSCAWGCHSLTSFESTGGSSFLRLGQGSEEAGLHIELFGAGQV